MKKLYSSIMIYIVYFKDVYSSYIESDEDFVLGEIEYNFTDDERQEISSIALELESICDEYIRNGETETSNKRSNSNNWSTGKRSKLTNTEDYTSFELEKQEFDSVVTFQPCNDKMIEDNLINPIGGSDIAYLEGDTNDKGDLSILHCIIIVEPQVDRLKNNDNLKSIEEQAVVLIALANKILNKLSRKDIKQRYEKKFNDTNSFFIRSKNMSEHELSQKFIDYSLLDQQIFDFFFQQEYNKEMNQTVYCFSEAKFSSFLLMDKSKFFPNLYMLIGFPDYEILNLIEYFAIQRFYKQFPELIVLESCRVSSPRKQSTIFPYLRSLRVLLDYWNDNQEDITEFRYKIIRFVKKIMVSVTNMKTCDFDYKLTHRKLLCCDKTHMNNYFNIFVYNVDFAVKSGLKKKLRIIKGDVIFEYMALTGIYLIYNHLLFNNYLYDKQHGDKEKIEKFIDLINEESSCIDCLMTSCISVICKKDMNLSS